MAQHGPSVATPPLIISKIATSMVMSKLSVQIWWEEPYGAAKIDKVVWSHGLRCLLLFIRQPSCFRKLPKSKCKPTMSSAFPRDFYSTTHLALHHDLSAPTLENIPKSATKRRLGTHRSQISTSGQGWKEASNIPMKLGLVGLYKSYELRLLLLSTHICFSSAFKTSAWPGMSSVPSCAPRRVVENATIQPYDMSTRKKSQIISKLALSTTMSMKSVETGAWRVHGATRLQKPV